MADEDPLSLADFLERSLADKDISGETFLAGATKYQELRDFLEKHPDIAPKLLSPDSNEVKRLVQEICDSPGAILGVAGQVERSILANRLPIASDEAIDTARWARTKSAIAKRREKTAGKVKRFFDILEEKRLYGSAEKTEAARKELNKPIDSLSLEEIHAETIRRLVRTTSDKPEAAKIIDEALTQTGLDRDLVEESRVVQAATQTMLTHPEIVNPEIVIEAIETGRGSEAAAGLARMATVVNQSRGTKEGVESFGKVAGSIVAEVFPGLTAKNLPETFARVWEVATGNSEKFLGNMTERLGKGIVESREFRDLISRGNEQASQRRGGGFGNIFSVPRARAADVEDYVEAIWRYDQGANINIQEFFLAKAHKDHPLLFHFEPGASPLEWILSWGAKKKAGNLAAEAIGTKVGAKALGGKIGAWLGSVLPLPPGIAQAAGYVLGEVILSRVIEWGGKLLAGAGYLMSGGVFSSILQGKPASLLDTFVLLPVVLVGALVLLFVFPSFLNIQQFPDVVRNAALVTDMGGENIGAPQPECLNIAITAAPVPSGVTPASIQYVVTANPTCEGELTINEAVVSFSIYGGGSINSQNITPEQLSDGSHSFTVPLGTQFTNAVITAIFTINATVGSTSTGGSTTVSTVVGNPTIECFVFGGAGQPDAYGHVSSEWGDRSGIMGAIGELAKSTTYMSHVCANDAPLTLYRVNADFGGGSVSGANTIFIYNAGARGMSAVYTLAHETGHIIDHRTGLFSVYNNQEVAPKDGGFIWTYPNGLTEHEDFAETFGVYVVWRRYSFGSRHGRSGALNYPAEYPEHYKFAKSVFGIEY